MSIKLLKTITTTPTINVKNFDVSGGILYCVDSGATAKVHKYNYATGAVIDSSFISYPNPYRMRCYGNRIYFAGGIGLKAFSDTGQALNSVSISGSYSVCVVNDIAYVGTYSAPHIYAYDASNLTIKTGFPVTLTTNCQAFGLAVDNNVLYVADRGTSRISTVNATTGSILNLNFMTGLTNISSVDVSGNDLYVGFTSSASVYNLTTKALNYTIATGLTDGDRRLIGYAYGVTSGTSIKFYSDYVVASKPIINRITPGINCLIVEFASSEVGYPAPFAQYYSLDGGDYTIADSTTSPIIIRNLTVIKSYSVRIITQNATGISEASDIREGTPIYVSPNVPVVYSAPPRVVNSLSGSRVSQDRRAFVNLTVDSLSREEQAIVNKKTQTSVGKLSGSDVTNMKRIKAIGGTEFSKK